MTRKLEVVMMWWRVMSALDVVLLSFFLSFFLGLSFHFIDVLLYYLGLAVKRMRKRESNGYSSI